MAWAGDRVAIQRSLAQRTAIVRANVVDGVILPAGVDQHHQRVVDLHDDPAGIRNVGRLGNGDEVGHEEESGQGLVVSGQYPDGGTRQSIGPLAV